MQVPADLTSFLNTAAHYTVVWARAPLSPQDHLALAKTGALFADLADELRAAAGREPESPASGAALDLARAADSLSRCCSAETRSLHELPPDARDKWLENAALAHAAAQAAAALAAELRGPGTPTPAWTAMAYPTYEAPPETGTSS